MAKRFIDTGIFRKPSIRAMDAPYKALFIYLLCECDHAGVWDVEVDVAATRLGVKLVAEKALAGMGGAVIAIDGGRKWWIPEFVSFQYGTLNPANKVHASVIAILSKYGVDPFDAEKEGAYKGLGSPLEGAKDKDKDKDTQEGKERADARNPEAQEVIDYLLKKFKPFNVAKLDPDPVTVRGKTMDGNRLHAATLLKNMQTAYPDFKPMVGAKKLIDIAIADDFERSNCTKVHYLVKHMSRIIAKSPKTKAEPGSSIKPWMQ